MPASANQLAALESFRRFLERQRDVERNAETVKKIHGSKHSLEEFTLYPDHAARKGTPEYKKVHNDLVKTKNLPCLACGVTYKTLKDKNANPYGAKQLETHHHVIEWSLANAIDPQKFNQRVRPHLRHKHPHGALYQREMSAKEIADWVDHHPDNLWVLCDIHHRHKWLGVHAITFPIWGPQDILKPSFERLAYKMMVENLLGNAKKKSKAATKKARG